MKKDQGILSRLIEIRRLMRRAGISLNDALDLLEDQLRYFEEHERHREEQQHTDLPLWLYGQEV